jgi:hypothetical protein
MLRIVTVMAMLGGATSVWAAPCTTASSACAEWISLGSGRARSLVYRSHPLTAPNSAVTRALIIVHGSDRDAAGAFQIGLDTARLAGALDDTIVIAPRFASRDGFTCRDVLADHEISWPCEGNSWRSGGASAAAVTSFDLADEVLRKVATKTTFPHLNVIVVSGHSAGGQFVTRYEMANRVHETLGVQVRYVVANPSSYAYPDAKRPLSAEGVGFGPLEDDSCDAFNTWPYGLDDRRGYADRAKAAELKRQLAARPTTYLLGARDVLPVDGFDASCAAMAQGPTRLERGRSFAAYVNERLGGRHAVIVVPNCAHDARCMFTAPSVRPTLFPSK